MSDERKLEAELIETLRGLKYEYRGDIRDRASLERNFRDHFQKLNNVKLADAEFSRLLEEIVTGDVFVAAHTLRNINSFIRDDGTPLNYTLVNIKQWCKNTFEVVSQLRINTDYSHHRYDVILLINGVPVVQIELKSLGINPRRAMEQIVEYKNDPGNGYTRTLLSFIQLFVVSNKTDTWYFANNNARHFAFNADERFLPMYQHANEDNTKVTHLDLFAEKFLAKCTLGQMISKYMVLVESEQMLLVMRPYQIYAVKNIVQCIEENRGNGYIWHTTGSGKTLTSFKAATLLKQNPNIEKCLFVVDRKDLDRQTRDEFNRFQEGCVEENTNTAALVRRLTSEDYVDKVIVCTIQKLGLALDEGSKRNKQREKRGVPTFAELLEPLKDKRMVFIFDECHRSQFGETHQTIKEFFPKAQLFGFTGTPIFEANSTVKQINGEEQILRTTEDLFQSCLHEYTITHAIEDRNVLRFHVDFYEPNTDQVKPDKTMTRQAVVDAILDKHHAATGERKFNALLATSSIDDAMHYYDHFDATQRGRSLQNPDYEPLKVAAVFSPPSDVSPDVRQLQEDLLTEKWDNKRNPEEKKKALVRIIADYNDRYGTNHTIVEFDAYYKDVQSRIKLQQFPNADFPKKGEEKVDLVIVVDMLLTGFDSKYLNTLYVDKRLKHHGLIQAFSRTNRVLNDTKPYGHILDFKGQREAVDEAIAMFSGAKAEKAREIWLVDKAPIVIEMLKKAKQELDEFFKSQELTGKPEDVANLKGDDARAAFVKHFKEVQRLETQLDQYTDLTPEQEAQIETIIPSEALNAFRGQYLETAKRLREQQRKPGDEKEDPVDQLDFELVLFASAMIDYDYIIKLVTEFQSKPATKQRMSREELIAIIAADSKFVDDPELKEYVMGLDINGGYSEAEIREGLVRFKAEKAAKEIANVASKQGIPLPSLQSFVDAILYRMIFDGDKLTELVEPLGLSWRARTEKELALMADLIPLLKKRAGGREVSGLQAYEE